MEKDDGAFQGLGSLCEGMEPWQHVASTVRACMGVQMKGVTMGLP